MTGLAGWANDVGVAGVGVVFRRQEEFDLAVGPSYPGNPFPQPQGKPWATGLMVVKGKQPAILGGAFDPTFAELTPRGRAAARVRGGVTPPTGSS